MHYYLTEFDRKYSGENAYSDVSDDFEKVKRNLGFIAFGCGSEVPYGFDCVTELTTNAAGFFLAYKGSFSQITLTTNVHTKDSEAKAYLYLGVKHFEEKIDVSKLELIANTFDLDFQGTRKCEE